jgi:hypothetical protein
MKSMTPEIQVKSIIYRVTLVISLLTVRFLNNNKKMKYLYKICTMQVSPCAQILLTDFMLLNLTTLLQRYLRIWTPIW